jgi:hypothetical protein
MHNSSINKIEEIIKLAKGVLYFKPSNQRDKPLYTNIFARNYCGQSLLGEKDFFNKCSYVLQILNYFY